MSKRTHQAIALAQALGRRNDVMKTAEEWNLHKGGSRRLCGCGTCERTRQIQQDAFLAGKAEEVAKSDKRIIQLIYERDEAQDAISHAYFLIIGHSPEWSNLFGTQHALQEIDEAQALLRETINQLIKRISELESECQNHVEHLTAKHQQGLAEGREKGLREAVEICKSLMVQEGFGQVVVRATSTEIHNAILSAINKKESS